MKGMPHISIVVEQSEVAAVWLLRYFVKFPVQHRCHLRVIIDERPLPKDDPDPYTTLKIILNYGVRKEFQTTTDVVTKWNR